MDGRTFKVFLATFLVSSVVLASAWFFIDGLMNLDEFLAAAGPSSDVTRLAIRHYRSLIGLHGGTLLTSIGLTSAVVAVARARRPIPLS